MSSVRDLWTKPNPDKGSRTKRVRGPRWGKGKRWQAKWVENGKLVYQAFDTEDAARAHLAKVLVGQEQGTWINKDKQQVTLGDLWEPWIASKAGKADSTIAGYTTAWNCYIEPVWGSIPIGKLDGAEIAAWLPTLEGQGAGRAPVGKSTQRKVGIVLGAMLAYAVKRKIIIESPLASEDVSKQDKPPRRYLRVDEIDRLRDAAPTEAAALMFMVLLMTGIRPGEARGLKVRDFDPDRGRIHIHGQVNQLGIYKETTKTGTVRDVPVGGDLLLDLEDWIDTLGLHSDDWLLPDEHGALWTEARWRRVWARMCTSAGVEGVTTYELRHTAATTAIAAGADVYAVQRMLGHSSAAPR